MEIGSGEQRRRVACHRMLMLDFRDIQIIIDVGMAGDKMTWNCFDLNARIGFRFDDKCSAFHIVHVQFLLFNWKGRVWPVLSSLL